MIECPKCKHFAVKVDFIKNEYQCPGCGWNSKTQPNRLTGGVKKETKCGEGTASRRILDALDSIMEEEKTALTDNTQ